MPLAESELLEEIYTLLYRLGATANYSGFFHASSAILMAAREPQRLLRAVDCLYCEVATQYRTNWHAVERNIRTLISVIWERNPALLGEYAGCPLPAKPTPACFISILAAQLSNKLEFSYR